jgi:hypothetical protein
MKKIIFTFALFCLSFTLLFAQNFAGKRIINGSLQMNLSNNTVTQAPQSSASGLSSSNFALSTTFLTGKIRANNTYKAYGLNLMVSSSSNTISSTSSNSRYTLGPIIQFGKFVKIFDQFYFSPNSTFGISGSFSSQSPNPTNRKSSGFGASASISPLNFVYQVKDNFLLSMNLGGFGINYNNQNASEDNGLTNISNSFSVYGSVTNFSGIGAYYLF